MTGADDTLSLTITSEADTLDRMQNVIGDHLARFAVRENLELEWQLEAASAPTTRPDT